LKGNEAMTKTTVTMTFMFDGTPEEATNFLQTQLIAFGADGVADFINGDEKWTVNGNPIDIFEEINHKHDCESQRNCKRCSKHN
jgi:hypothetical protein